MSWNLIKAIRERKYFNPYVATRVDEKDFMKILRGEFRDGNPFMIVGVDRDSPLNSWAGQRWGANGYDKAFENTSWYGKFVFGYASTIVMTRNFQQIDFNPYAKDKLGRFLVSEFREPPHCGGGFMQADKDLFNRVLVSNLGITRMESCVEDVYGEM